jgi:hypothetical protein
MYIAIGACTHGYIFNEIFIKSDFELVDINKTFYKFRVLQFAFEKEAFFSNFQLIRYFIIGNLWTI